MTRPPHLISPPPTVVRYDPGAGPGPSGEGQALVDLVQRDVDEWVETLCSFLHRRPPEPILVTLRPGTWVARTKGTHVLLPVAPGAGVESAIGAVRAALAHELVHAVTGRLSNDALNEGLAVHVDSTLRLAGPSWPFYDLSPHRWVAIFRHEGTFFALADLLSGRAAPRAGVPIDTVILQWARYYLEAGSFAGHLVDELGVERFLSPGGTGPSLPDGEDLVAMEQAWLAAIGPPPTEAEWQSRHESVTRQAVKHRDEDRSAECVRPPR